MLKNVVKIVALGFSASLIAALAVVPAIAQQNCCQSGTIIEGNFGGDVKTMNPILSSDTASARVIGLMNIALVGIDPNTGSLAQNQPGALAKTWDVSADGLTYTFHLRNDLVWSDGTPITAADVVYSWNAIKAGQAGNLDTPLSYLYDPADKTNIADLTAPDDNTIVMTFYNNECTSLLTAATVPVVPSHILPSDVTTLGDSDYNLNPTVTSGAFNFGGFRPGEQVSLVGSPTYKDAIDGQVEPAGYIYKNVPDANVNVEQFLAGQLNLIDGPTVGRRGDIRDAVTAGKDQAFSYAGNAWDYLAFNQADPNNPQSAVDGNNNPIDQGHHPLFGDVAVRQALSHAVDVDAVIKAALFGEGTAMTSWLVPSSWANDSSLKPVSFDPKLAAQMLAAAGWIDDDNDPSTPLVAKGAKYAPDGTKFEFTLYTNSGNSRRAAIGQLVQDQFAQIGVKVDFQAIDFNTLLDLMNAQTFDAIILGWRDGFPSDPDATQLFTPAGDVVGSGNNFTSFNDPQFNALNAQAKSIAGCKPEDRAPIYHQMQQIIQNDAPYIFVDVQNGMYAATADVQGFDPKPQNLLWNVDQWKADATP